MRVLLVSSVFQPAWDWGGPVRSAWLLAKGLAAAGVRVTVVTTDARQHGRVHVPRVREEEGVRILTAPILGGGHWTGANRFGLSLAVLRPLIREVRRASLLHVQGVWGGLNSAAFGLAWLLGKPFLVSPRGHLEGHSLQRKALKKRLALALGARWQISRAAALHFTTHREADGCPDMFAELERFVVPNPVAVAERGDGQRFRQRLDVPEGALLIGMFGRIHPIKGFDVLLPALARIEPGREVRLVLVGPDEGNTLSQVRAHAARVGLGSKLIATGILTGAALADAYAGVDLAAVPSYGESFGNVVVEAALQGTPVLVSDRVGLAEWVREQRCGEVVPLTVDAWAASLGAFVNRGGFPKWDGARARRTAEAHFSVPAVAKSMLRAYEEVLA